MKKRQVERRCWQKDNDLQVSAIKNNNVQLTKVYFLEVIFLISPECTKLEASASAWKNMADGIISMQVLKRRALHFLCHDLVLGFSPYAVYS